MITTNSSSKCLATENKCYLECSLGKNTIQSNYNRWKGPFYLVKSVLNWYLLCLRDVKEKRGQEGPRILAVLWELIMNPRSGLQLQRVHFMSTHECPSFRRLTYRNKAHTVILVFRITGMTHSFRNWSISHCLAWRLKNDYFFSYSIQLYMETQP